MSELARILLVDDNPKYLKDALPFYGYQVEAALDGVQALKLLSKNSYDLILLDIMMPNMNGWETLKAIRNNKGTEYIPIIILTAVNEEQKIISGLKRGADDYIVKPFSRSILIARIRAQLRKFTESGNSDEIRYNELLINRELHLVRLGEEHLELTFTEFEILALFASHPGRVYTRNQIVSKIKGDDYPVTDRAIDVQIVNLRRKLGVFGANIETVRGVGYRMRQQAEY